MQNEKTFNITANTSTKLTHTLKNNCHNVKCSNGAIYMDSKSIFFAQESLG